MSSTTNDLRKTGIDVLGGVPWGTHFCQFYETKKDLLELLVPYFKTGLESNEFCLWAIYDPITKEEANNALKKVIPDFDQYIEKKSIEIVSIKEWYGESGTFEPQLAIEALFQKSEEALNRNYDGMRVNGNEAWLSHEDWESFMEYENELNNLTYNRKMIVLCTYPLLQTDGRLLLDVAHAHESVISKRKGHWEILEEPQLRMKKAELMQQNKELDTLVAERTGKLEKAVSDLKKEIEERKKAEEQIKRQVELSNEIIDAIPVMAWSVLPNGKVDFVNQRWMNYAGLSFNEAVEGANRIIHPEDLQQVIENWTINLTAGNSYDDEMRLRAVNGEYRWFLVRTAPLREHGKVIKWFGVAIDIEDSKRAQDELRLAYQRLSYHVENTPLAVIEFDKDLFIKRWSKRAEEIFGWKASEALGKNVYDTDFPFIYKEDIQAVDKINEQLLKGMVNSNLSLNRNYTKDGKVIYNEWYNSVLKDENGNVITILSLIDDVTERKKAEKSLDESYQQIRNLSEHLQRIREEERTHIAREIHDELGQKLTVMKMDVSWLTKKIGDNSAIKDRLDDLMEILDATVQSVRKISSELRPHLLDLGLCDAIEWHLKEFEKRSGIKITFNEPREKLELADSIKTGLFRIFQESLTNVARHSKANHVQVDLIKNKEQLVLSITDNGKGFNIQKINQKTTLGILGMKERAAMMGGNYDIESKPGKGTIITVTIPFGKKEQL